MTKGGDLEACATNPKKHTMKHLDTWSDPQPGVTWASSQPDLLILGENPTASHRSSAYAGV
jgi:hypothetical protein